MNKYPIEFAVAELQGTRDDPNKLARNYKHLERMLGRPGTAVVARREHDGLVQFRVKDGAGGEQLKSWSEFFTIDILEARAAVLREKPNLIADIWPDVCAALESEFPDITDSHKDEAHAYVSTNFDDYDIDALETFLSWGKTTTR
jgi:hypothetical protein